MTEKRGGLAFLPLGGTGEIGMNLNLYCLDGTWLAVDDMGAKPLAGTVTVDGGALRVVNTSGYAWTDARLVVDGVFAAPVVAGPIASGDDLRVPLTAFVDRAGRPAEAPHEVAITVTRVPRFPKVNRARTASGTWPLDSEPSPR